MEALVAAADHFDVFRRVDRKQVLADRVVDHHLQGAENLAGRCYGDAGIAQPVPKISHNARRELAKANPSDAICEGAQPLWSTASGVSLRIGANVIADMAFVDLVVVPRHALSALHPILAVLKELIGGVADSDLAGVGKYPAVSALRSLREKHRPHCGSRIVGVRACRWRRSSSRARRHRVRLDR